MTKPPSTDEGLRARATDLHSLSDKEFEIFRALVYEHTGISLSESKRPLLQARLTRRLRALGLATFSEYHRVLMESDSSGEELGRFVNAITTNKTDFFREPHHFRHLAEEWVPAAKARAAKSGDRAIRIWSAGCSTGEEPYSIAMTIRDALGTAAGWDVKILASDLDTDVLARADAGVYSVEQAAPIPQATLSRHFLRGRGADAGRVRVRPELRSLITFRRINFLDARWPIRGQLDIIFCRNVIIYFDRLTKQRVLQRLLGLLKDDGLLILGHSESVYGLLDGVKHLGNTMYRRISTSGPAAPGL